MADGQAKAAGSRRLGRRGWIITIGVAAVVAATAGGGAVFAAAGGTDGHYRTATAELADVTQTLALTGQISATDSASVAFQVSGTVKSVTAKLGQRVAAGQTLAALDTTALTAAVTSARSAVTTAQQTLDQDLAAQSNGTGNGTGSGTGSSASGNGNAGGNGSGSAAASTGSAASNGSASRSASSPAPSTRPSGGGSTGSSGSGGGTTSKAVETAQKAVVAAQQALLSAYQESSSAQEKSSASFTAAQTACAPFADATITDGGQSSGTGTSPTDAPTDAPTADPSATPSPSPSASGGTSATDAQALLATCQDAIAATQDLQAKTDAAQKDLQQKATALNRTVTELQKALASTTTSSGAAATTTSKDASSTPKTTSSSSGTAQGSVQGSGGTGGSATTRTGTASSAQSAGSGASQTVTAAQIITDRARIDAAEAEVQIAEQSLGMATLTTPIGGTITSIGMAAGDAVSAGSSSAVITVQQDGGYTVAATVPLTQITGVEVGQSASVTLPSFGTTFPATVASIGVLDVSQTSTPSYTVTLSVDTGSKTARIGATAQATVTLANVSHVLTVPTSAVTKTGSTATVKVVENGTAQTTRVELGVVGAERTQITSGLKAGQEVVLADLDQEIPSTDSSTSTGLGSLTSGGNRSQRFVTGDFPSGFSPRGNGG